MEDLKVDGQLLGPVETEEQGRVNRMIGVAVILVLAIVETLFDFRHLLKRLWE